MMKAWQVTELGEPEDVLTINHNLPVPKPKDSEVLIKVESVALNFFDILLCQGKYQERPPKPFTIGAEVSGVVEATGKEVTAFTKGQKVIATPPLPNGGLAEYVSVDEQDVYVIPEEMSSAEAAALHITYQTAYYSLFNRASLKENETLLVHAASGGVGSAAVQLGKSLGATVIATVGSEEKENICHQLGADYVINYAKDNFIDEVNRMTEDRGADVIFDPVGGDVFAGSRRCIAFDGRILVIGFASGEIADAPTNHALVKNYSIVGVHFGLYKKLFPEGAKEQHEKLIELYKSKTIRPLIYKEFDFTDVPQALNLLGDRKTYGKVIIDM